MQKVNLIEVLKRRSQAVTLGELKKHNDLYLEERRNKAVEGKIVIPKRKFRRVFGL